MLARAERAQLNSPLVSPPQLLLGTLAKLVAAEHLRRVGEAKSESPPSGLPRGGSLHKLAESVRQQVQLPQNKESAQQVRSEAGGGAAAAKNDPADTERPTPPQGGALVGPGTKEAFTGFGPTSQLPPTLAGPAMSPRVANDSVAAGANNFLGSGFKPSSTMQTPATLNAYQGLANNQGVGGPLLGAPLAAGQASAHGAPGAPRTAKRSTSGSIWKVGTLEPQLRLASYCIAWGV